jgi:coenzyme A diphosphatase NUDT7
VITVLAHVHQVTALLGGVDWLAGRCVLVDLQQRGDDDDDADLATALREAEEEIGLRPAQLEVLCQMERTVAVGGLLTGVVVALVRDASYMPVANPAEVATTFTVPLALFLRRGRRHWHRDIGGDDAGATGVAAGARWQRQRMRMHYFEHRDGGSFVVWGLTAAILIHVAEVAFAREAAFDKNAPSAIDGGGIVGGAQDSAEDRPQQRRPKL